MSHEHPADDIQVRCRFEGRVQGVGFRYTATSISKKYQVTGFVMNRPDGSVELVAEGVWKEVSQFVHDVQQSFVRQITRCEQQEGAATGEFADFRIRHG